VRERGKSVKRSEVKNTFQSSNSHGCMTFLIHMWCFPGCLHHKIEFRSRNSQEISGPSWFDRKHEKHEYIPNVLLPHKCSLVEEKIHSQTFLSSTPSPDTDLFSDLGKLPGHCDFISSSSKLAEHLPTSQMLGDLINVNVCVKMKCCLPNKCQVIQIFYSYFWQAP
jgi:hypothetical protein